MFLLGLRAYSWRELRIITRLPARLMQGRIVLLSRCYHSETPKLAASRFSNASDKHVIVGIRDNFWEALARV